MPYDSNAATGIGRSVDNPFYRVHFDMEPSPAVRIQIRYEYRPRLLDLGVLH
jgi:hypothetical protein